MPYGDQIPAQLYGQSRTTGIDRRVLLDDTGSQSVAQTLPPLTELARQGLYTARIASGSAYTYVAGLPTTRAELVLYNGDPQKSYVVTGIWNLSITSMAAAGSIALIAQVVMGGAAPTDDTAQLITASDGRPYGGLAKRAVAQTTMIANKWDLLATSQSGGSATAQIGLASFADCYGKIVLRPGGLLGVNVVAGTAAGTAVMGIQWAEVLLNY